MFTHTFLFKIIIIDNLYSKFTKLTVQRILQSQFSIVT